MAKARTYSQHTKYTSDLLARYIKLGRRQKKWSESELAARAGLSRTTVQKIEKGDLSCSIGSVFELATLVGVRLFDDDTSALPHYIAAAADRLTLLPGSAHSQSPEPDDDF